MNFEKPEYPDTLKRRNWDKNKSVLAKMKGYTGLGDALDQLEEQYNKVKWGEIFDLKEKFGSINQYMENHFTLAKLAAAERAAMDDVKTGECGKLRTKAYEVRDLATATAKDYDKNPIIPKKTAQLARDIATAADHLGVAANMNSMGPIIQEMKRLVMHPIDSSIAMIEKNYAAHILALEHAVVALVQNPSYETWKSQGTMTLCRNLNQQIGNVEKFVSFGCDLGMDAAHCKQFFEDMQVYAREDVPFEQDAPVEEIKKHVAELVQLVKRAKALK